MASICLGINVLRRVLMPWRHEPPGYRYDHWLCKINGSLFSTRKEFSHLRLLHDDVIKWKHFPRYWPFVRGIHRSPVTSPHKGQWRGALMFSLICVWINGWVNNREAGDLRRYRAHYDPTVMQFWDIIENVNVYSCFSNMNLGALRVIIIH